MLLGRLWNSIAPAPDSPACMQALLTTGLKPLCRRIPCPSHKVFCCGCMVRKPAEMSNMTFAQINTANFTDLTSAWECCLGRCHIQLHLAAAAGQTVSGCHHRHSLLAVMRAAHAINTLSWLDVHANALHCVTWSTAWT